MDENNQKGVCPECGSTNIHYGALEPTDSEDSVMYPCFCNDCNCDFTEYYTMTYSETIIG